MSRGIVWLLAISTGCIVAPDSDLLRNELEQRCVELRLNAASRVRVFRLLAKGLGIAESIESA